MPRETVRRAKVLKKLQDSIQHKDSNITAGRRLSVEKWLKTYIEQVEHLKDNQLQFLYSVFRDENCWSDVRLNNVTLGQRFAQDEINGIKNPLYNKYGVACRYCIIDRIPTLFQEKFEFYKSSFPPGPVDNSGNHITDECIKSKLLEHMNSRDPILVFWVNEEDPKELKKHDDPVKGFDIAVRFKWSEGVEYFYNHLKEEDKEKKLTETIISLSAIQCTQNEADILDFCVSKIVDKNALLEKLSQTDRSASLEKLPKALLEKLSRRSRCVYSLFSRLMSCDFHYTVKRLIDDWCCKEQIPVAADKVLSYKDYALFLSSLSNQMLENTKLGTQAKRMMIDLWKSNHFNEHKKFTVNVSGRMLPIKTALSGLVVNWNGSDDKLDEKEEMLDIISFAKDCFPEKFELFKKRIITNLRLVGRQGMKEGVNYSKLAEELFSELEKTSLLPGPGGDGHYLGTRSKISDSKKTSLPPEGSGDRPQPILEAPSTSSGVSSRRNR